MQSLSPGVYCLSVSAEVELPLEDTELDNRNYDDEKQQVGGFGTPHGKIHIKQQINHDGEVNRARWVYTHRGACRAPAPHTCMCTAPVMQRLRGMGFEQQAAQQYCIEVTCRGGSMCSRCRKP